METVLQNVSSGDFILVQTPRSALTHPDGLAYCTPRLQGTEPMACGLQACTAGDCSKYCEQLLPNGK